MNNIRRSFRFGCIILLLLSPLALATLPPCPQNGFDQQVAKYRDYTIRTIRTNIPMEFPGCLEVRKAGVVVYRESRAVEYGIGNGVYGDPAIPAIKVGTDVTGAGIPDAIIWSWSGGAHCCYKFQVLQLGKQFLDVADIDAEHSDGAHFADLRHDGHYEFVANDWAFAYWNASFAESPAPQIILRPTGLHLSKSHGSHPDTYIYNLALDLMKRPPPTATAFESLVHELSAPSEWNGWNGNGVPPELWGEMLNFIYIGHPALAWKLLDQSWPKKKPGKDGFIGAFCNQLGHSLYRDDLGPLLKDAPADCFQ